MVVTMKDSTCSVEPQKKSSSKRSLKVSMVVLEYRRWCARFTIDDTFVTQP